MCNASSSMYIYMYSCGEQSSKYPIVNTHIMTQLTHLDNRDSTMQGLT